MDKKVCDTGLIIVKGELKFENTFSNIRKNYIHHIIIRIISNVFCLKIVNNIRLPSHRSLVFQLFCMARNHHDTGNAVTSHQSENFR